MFDLNIWVESGWIVLNPGNLMAALGGTLAGFIIGVLPGLGTVMAVALLLPFTFGMDAATSIILFLAIYGGAQAGNSISAILIGTPGTPGAAATVVDGYPLAKQGRGAEAIGVSMYSSFVGNILSILVFIILAPVVASFSVAFGPREYFWLGVFGLTAVASFTEGSLSKGLIGCGIGLLLATVGMNPVTGEFRFTGGHPELWDGFSMVPVLVGLFAVSQAFILMNERSVAALAKPEPGRWTNVFLSLRDVWKLRMTFIRSGTIGCAVGALPGAGTDLAAWLAWSDAKRSSRRPQDFGKGAREGVAAPECANNAVVGTSLIPLVSLGIPGSPTAAVILAGLLIHGLVPGRSLFTEQAAFTYTIILGYLLASVFMLLIGLAAASLSRPIWYMPKALLVPIIISLSIVGAFSVSNSMFDVYTVIAFGLVGYVIRVSGFDPAPIVLGFILGPIIERGFLRSMIMSGNDILYMFQSSISAVLIVLIALSLCYPLFRWWMVHRS